MIVSKCPSCHEAVTIPSAPRESRARCPLCSEEYTLAEALERCPPVLELLDVPEHAEEDFGGYALSSVAASGMADSGFATEGAPPQFDFSESPAPATASTSAASSEKPASTTTKSPTSVARRPRKQAKNPAIEIVKVIGGGALGLFIAQMLLWWLPFNLSNGQRDPTSLGKNIGPYVPWLVPAQVRGVSDPAAADADDQRNPTSDKDAAALKDDSVWGQAAREQAERDNNGGRPRRNNRQGARQGGNQPAKGSGAGANNPTTNTGLGGTQLPGMAVLPDNAADPFGGGGTDPFGEEENLLDSENLVDPEAIDVDIPPTTPEPPEEPSQPARRASGFKAVGKRTAGDVAKALEAVREANQAYDSASEDTPAAEKLALANNLYADLAQLGVVLAHVDSKQMPQMAPHVKELNEFLTSLGENKYNGLAYLASRWLGDNDRANHGVVLVGTVQGIKQLGGEYYRSQISLGGDNNAEVVGWVPPQAEFQPGARVLILGTMVNDPGDKLINFSGSGGEVICGSFSQVLEPASPDDASSPKGD